MKSVLFEVAIIAVAFLAGAFLGVTADNLSCPPTTHLSRGERL